MTSACRAKFFSLYSTVSIHARTRRSSSGGITVSGFTVNPRLLAMFVSPSGRARASRPAGAGRPFVPVGGCALRHSGRAVVQKGAFTSFHVGLFTAMSMSRAKTGNPW